MDWLMLNVPADSPPVRLDRQGLAEAGTLDHFGTVVDTLGHSDTAGWAAGCSLVAPDSIGVVDTGAVGIVD